jgi:hypothetical protein
MANSSCPVSMAGGVPSCGLCVLRQRKGGGCKAAQFPPGQFGLHLYRVTYQANAAQYVRLVVAANGQQVLPRAR